MNVDTLKNELVDIIDADVFDFESANRVLAELKSRLNTYPFWEAEPLDSDEYDLLGHTCVFGSLSALKWVLQREVMGPPEVDVSCYTALALADDLADETTLQFLLTNYGVSFSEVCFGDLDQARQELAVALGAVEADED